MKKIILLVAIAFCLKGNAQTYVNIPDPNFVTYLQGLIPSAMSGSLLNTSSPLVTTTTYTIDCHSLAISNLSGIQYFTSLTDLECYSNSLTTLPALPSTLILLDCFYNNLTSLPALPTSLTWLDCENNSLTTLPALPNSITWLGCSHNSLTSLPTLPNSLQELGCSYNSLTTLPSLPNSLEVLACDNNSLTTLPALPASLFDLDCNNNSLTTLPTLPNSLTELQCGNNNISCFPTFPNSLVGDTIGVVSLNPNPYTCLPNYVLPTMNSYTTTPLCAAGNTNSCPVSTAGIRQYNVNNSISMYPNPTTAIINIELKEQDGTQNTTLYITDVLGNEIMQATPQEGKANIDVSSLQSGVYFIKTTQGTQKFIKQ